MSGFNDALAVSRLRKIWIELGELVNSARDNVYEYPERIQMMRRPTSPTSSFSDDAALVFAKEIYRFRRKRGEFFSDTLFADPSWDILLELYVLRREGRRTSVKSVCAASGVPPTTALRWINLLVKEGLVERSNDLVDLRVRWVTLSDAGFEGMHKLLLSAVEPKEVAFDDRFQRNAARVAR